MLSPIGGNLLIIELDVPIVAVPFLFIKLDIVVIGPHYSMSLLLFE